jgi:uncharacterized damage-inducible protein DinB
MYNVQNLEACAALSAEQLNASLTGTYGSIHDTLQHAERSYFSPISTGAPYRRPQGHAGHPQTARRLRRIGAQNSDYVRFYCIRC